MVTRRIPFEKWTQQVSRILSRKIGLALEDVPDLLSHGNMYDQGVSPAQAAAAVVINLEDDGEFSQGLFSSGLLNEEMS